MKNEAALIVDDYVIIADLHIGYEEELEKKGIVTYSIEGLAAKVNKLRDYAEKLVINGDIKHNFLPVPKEIFLVKRFLSMLEFDGVILIKGNHDGKLDRFVDMVDKFEIGDITITHGHKRVPFAEKLVIGHVHPAVKLDGLHRCWIVGRCEGKKALVMPAFNPFLLGSTELSGAYKIEEEYRMLLDLTILHA